MKQVAARGAQYSLYSVFELDMADTVKNTAGVFQAANAASVVFDSHDIPNAAIILGGFLEVLTASNCSSTHTASVGVDGAPAQYLAATNIKAAARTAFTGVVAPNGKKIRVTLAAGAADATAGKIRVVVEYILPNRQTENQAA